jgi:hydroxyacylglutathione hydrolase
MNLPHTNVTSIVPIRAFSDNYIWCMHNQQHAVVVDPGDATPVIEYLTEHSLHLVAILITHHHYDHVGGIDQLIQHYPNIKVYGPINPKIGAITHRLKENDSVTLPEFNMQLSILETPGHTLDHVVYYNDELMFCGDTLFSGGCGRMFEGTPEVFYASLQKLAALPAETKVYCTHEYTQANINFATSIEPNNVALLEYAKWVKVIREEDKVTLPSTIKNESEINPFLRCHIKSTQSKVLDSNSQHKKQANIEIATFAALRALKDNF